MRTITAITDLTFGDAGKGTSVQRFVKETGSKLVLRTGGGAQCAHTVTSPTGVTHTFTQFGSGTLVGAKTFYGPRAYFNPIVFNLEATKLEKKGVVNPKDLFYVHEDALVTTPYHRALNRLRELARNGSIHGSCGVGIGETARIGIEQPDIAIRMKDLLLPSGYLTLYYEDLVKEIWKEVCTFKGQLNPKCPLVVDEMQTFKIPEIEVIRKTQEAIKGAHIVSRKGTQSFLNNFDHMVAEGNQGILIDQDYGFHPYTTWSKTTSENVHLLCSENGLSHEIIDYGVIRTFLTRHGAGPMPSEAPRLADCLAEIHNTDNPWQHGFRFGYFDPLLINYAIAVNKGVDKLIVSHCDWLANTSWLCVNQYEGMGDIPILKYPNLLKQEEIGNKLRGVNCIYDTKAYNPNDVLDAIRLKLDKEIVMTSTGPEFDKYTLNPK